MPAIVPTETEIHKLGEMIKGVRCAMLTTIQEDGGLHSRPMATQQTDFDGKLWFLTSDATIKSREIQRDRRVNVSYVDPDDDLFVSVIGTAEIVHDKNKINEVWSPLHTTWLPKGLEDPHLALIKVNIEKAEYWDPSSGRMVQLFGAGNRLATA